MDAARRLISHLPEAKEAWLANEPYCLFQSSNAFRSAWLKKKISDKVMVYYMKS